MVTIINKMNRPITCSLASGETLTLCTDEEKSIKEEEVTKYLESLNERRLVEIKKDNKKVTTSAGTSKRVTE